MFDFFYSSVHLVIVYSDFPKTQKRHRKVSFFRMEAVGIEPTSEELSTKGATCLVYVFIFFRQSKHRQF